MDCNVRQFVFTGDDNCLLRGKTYPLKDWLQNEHKAKWDAVNQGWILPADHKLTIDQLEEKLAEVTSKKRAGTKRKRSETMKRIWKERKEFEAERDDPAKQAERKANWQAWREYSGDEGWVNFMNCDFQPDRTCRKCNQFIFSKPITQHFWYCPICGFDNLD